MNNDSEGVKSRKTTNSDKSLNVFQRILGFLFADFIYWFVTREMSKRLWTDKTKQGFLIERNENGETSYSTINAESRRVIIEYDDIHEYVVKKMKKAGVAIIPEAVMRDVRSGKIPLEDVLSQYQKPKNK